MFNDLELMRMANAMASHASTRQSAVAQNVANADTPGYRAVDVTSFAQSYAEAQSGMRTTRPAHIGATPGMLEAYEVDPDGRESPNGNTVALEAEMMKANEVRHQHDMALAIYQTALDILRMSIGRR